jgi:hypothetical protein
MGLFCKILSTPLPSPGVAILVVVRRTAGPGGHAISVAPPFGNLSAGHSSPQPSPCTRARRFSHPRSRGARKNESLSTHGCASSPPPGRPKP